MENTIPTSQQAVQLVGEDKLIHNTNKPVDQPGPYQILLKIEALGLCFSDLKLLKQFSNHARKSEIRSGADPKVLKEISSYKPGTEPVVPGHEAYGIVAAVGDKVTHHKVGEKVLVQTDYRWLKTDGSNSAFGYNFEGGLQQYVIVDERIIVEPDSGESFLIPVDKDISAASIALVEPWACVESSYITEERNTLKPGGRMLVVVDESKSVSGIAGCISDKGEPAEVTTFGISSDLEDIEVDAKEAANLADLPNEYYDDIVYFGSDKATIELLDGKLAAEGIINIVLCGDKIGEDVSVGVGRTHYGMTRWIGTVGCDASESYKTVPAMGEIRPNEKVVIIGAAGPMGQMHVIRVLSLETEGLTVVGTDFDDERLESLAKKARPLAEQNNYKLELVNPKNNPITEKFSYFAIMAPIGPLVAQAIKDSVEGALINIFAGIPATVKQEIDLDLYIANKCFMFGTSGSRLSDMKIVLDKVLTGKLNTNCSVDAISGIAGAIDGIRAVEARSLPGKIIVFPQKPDMPLTPLTELAEKMPEVAAKLDKGLWTKEAEEELLK